MLRECKIQGAHRARNFCQSTRALSKKEEAQTRVVTKARQQMIASYAQIFCIEGLYHWRDLFCLSKTIDSNLFRLGETIDTNFNERNANMDEKAQTQRWNELILLSLFRLFQASVFLILSMLGANLLPQHPSLPLRIAALIYLLGALLLWLSARRTPQHITPQVLIGATLDLSIAAISLHFFGGPASGAGALMLITVALTALLLPARLAAFVAAIAALVAVGEVAVSIWLLGDQSRNWAQSGGYGLGFFVVTGLIYWLGRRTQESRLLAERRGQDLLSLAEVNELIIQRMRTGVLVVDLMGQVERYNEAAWYLLGMPNPRERNLSHFARPLQVRLREWLIANRHDPTPLTVTTGVPQVIPRLAKIGTHADVRVLIFLEDETQLSRRAEELTLTSLGRLSASIAHEVRNPLGAISNAAQLLAESEQMSDMDRQLVDIINGQCKRMNGIVENVLQLSRRERSRPEEVMLKTWMEEFVRDFKQSLPTGHKPIRTSIERDDLRAMIDPSQLTQACWNLLRNAVAYGVRPGVEQDVSIRVRSQGDQPGAMIEIIDRGPGIPEKLQVNLFQPFFTTRADGTGLGLYICKELLEANQASIEYVNVPTGGSCFRIRMTAPAPRDF
jgi:two-component system, NtrC family, sensor histidine kinase PilS